MNWLYSYSACMRQSR